MKKFFFKSLFLSVLMGSQLSLALDNDHKNTSCGCFSWLSCLFGKSKLVEEKQRLIVEQPDIKVNLLTVPKTEIKPQVSPINEVDQSQVRIEIQEDFGRQNPESVISIVALDPKEKSESQPKAILEEKVIQAKPQEKEENTNYTSLGAPSLVQTFTVFPQPNIPKGHRLQLYKGGLWVFKGACPVHKY